jgi:hypothetical protein
MKIFKYILTFLFLISHFVYSQTDKITGNAFDDLSKIFTDSTMEVDIMDAFSQNPRFDGLLAKIDSVLVENPKWLDKYLSKLKKDNESIYSQLYFDKRFGLNKAEFQEFLTLEKEYKLISSGKSKLQIIKNKDSNIISFKNNENLKAMSDLRIDLANSKIYYKNIELKDFVEFTSLENETMLNSKMKGYSWSSMDEETLIEILEKKEYKFNQIILTISQLEKNGRFYISLSENKITSEILCSDIPSFKELSIML